MRTKLLFLSLALMTMGEVSEVKADTTIADLTATQVTAFDGAVKTSTDGYNVWTKESGPTATSGNNSWNWSTDGTYVLWSYKLTDNLVISQTINDAAAGTYLLKTYMSKNEGTASVTIKRGDETLATYNYTQTAGTYYVPFYNDAVGNIKFTYTFSGGGTINWGNDYLYSIKKDDATENYTTILSSATTSQIESMIAGMSEAKKALKDLLETANAVKTKWNSLHDATALFWVNETSFQNLSNAITTAQGVFDNSESTDEQFTAQKGLLQTAENGISFNTPAPAKYYYLSLWGAYLNMSEVISDGGWSTNQAPYVYQFEAVESTTDQYKIKDANGDYLKSYSGSSAYKVEKGEEGTAWKITPALYQDTKRVQIENTLRSGYYLYFRNSPETGNAVYAGTSSKSGYYPYFDVAEATTTNASMFISSAAEWGTFVAPFAVDLTGGLAGVEAYTITTDGTTITKSEALSTIPANTPVLLHKAGGLNATNVSGYAQSYYTGLPEEGNLVGFLTTGGSVPASVADGDTYYVLQKQGTVVGWYKVTSTLTGTVNRAYLKVPAGGDAARQFIPLFDDSETTGITQVNGENVKANDYYNLKGQRVSQPTKGLYIVGGRKVMVK